MAYLAEIFSAADVAMDPSKVESVEIWPLLLFVRTMWWFLRLTGYYCKFIAGYGLVAAPPNAFKWMDEANAAFLQLKQAMITAPLLQMPDFNKCFVIDCDVSGIGFGMLLHQGDNAIAYFSRPVALLHQKLSAY